MTFRRVVTRRAASSLATAQSSAASRQGLVAAGFTLLPRQEEQVRNKMIE